MAQRRKNKRKYVYWLMLLVLLVVAGVVAFLVWNNYFRDKGSDRQESGSVVVAEEDTGAKKDTESEDEANAIADRTVEEKKVVPYEGTDPNEHEELTGVVTYAGVNSGMLMIRVNIDQYLDGGTCELNLHGNATYSDTAKIVGGATTATCEGFNVPVDKLASGMYQIAIKINSGDKVGIIKGEVNI